MLRSTSDPLARVAPGFRRSRRTALSDDLSCRVLKSVGSNWVLNFAQIVVGFVVPPLLIHTLGTPVYGEWLNVVAWTGYLNLFLSGVPMATVRDFTKHIASKDQERLNKSIASTMSVR